MGDVGSGAIRFACSACGRQMKAPAAGAGRRAKCPGCHEVVTVPASLPAPETPAQTSATATERIEVVTCPHCSARMRAKVRADASVRCPRCEQRFNPAEKPASLDDELDQLLASEKSGAAVNAADAADPAELRLAPAAPQPPREPHPYVTRPTGPGPECPGCRQKYSPGTRICVACGIDLRSGKLLRMTADEHLNDAYVTAERTITVISWLIWWGIYPFATEAFGTRKPWAIRGIALATICISVLAWIGWVGRTPLGETFDRWLLWAPGSESWIDEAITETEAALVDGSDPIAPDERQELEAGLRELREAKAATGFAPYQLVTHAFLHDGILHLVGNLLFLMVLGSAVNRLVGNVLTLILYPLLAIASGLVQIAFEPQGALLGASGAIQGLSGMYLILFPVHRVHVAAWWRWGLWRGFHLSLGSFAVPGFVVVLFYTSFDVLSTALRVEDGVAHWAHLGGLGAGIITALVLLISRLINSRGGDLLSVLLGRRAWALIGGPRSAA